MLNVLVSPKRPADNENVPMNGYVYIPNIAGRRRLRTNLLAGRVEDIWELEKPAL